MSRSSRATTGAFPPAAMIAILLVGVLSLAGLGALSAYAPELRSGNDGGGHALSRASTGFGGLPRLLRSLGVPTLLSRGAVTEASYESLLILTPSIDTNPDQIEDLAHIGAQLIVLPKWIPALDGDRPGWVQTVGRYPTTTVRDVLPNSLRRRTIIAERSDAARTVLARPNGLPLGASVRTEGLRTISGPDWIPVVEDERGAAVLAMRRGTRTYVLADPDLLSTHGLKTQAGARTALALIDILRADGSPIVFDLTLHGFQRTRNLPRLTLEPPLLGMTLVLLALAIVAGFQAAVRFGPARDRARTIALGKQALADNTAGLVRLARREHQMATPYAMLVRAAVARAIGAPRALSDEALDAFLDRVGRTMGAGSSYSALAQQAKAAKTPGDLMQVARALHRWNQELTRARQ